MTLLLIFSYLEVNESDKIKGNFLKRAVINIFLIRICLWFMKMEANPVLDRETNHMNTYQDRGKYLSDLISDSQGYKVVTSDPDEDTGAPSSAR